MYINLIFEDFKNALRKDHQYSLINFVLVYKKSYLYPKVSNLVDLNFWKILNLLIDFSLVLWYFLLNDNYFNFGKSNVRLIFYNKFYPKYI